MNIQKIIDETVEWLYVKLNNGEMSVSDILKFTKEYQEYINKTIVDNSENEKFIDLGLPSGNLWCDRNIGANSSESYGDYLLFCEACRYNNLPSKEDFQELIDNCKWERTQVNEIYGSRVIGPNGNYIFLPAAGDRDESSLNDQGYFGYYWSSTPYDRYYGAYSLYFDCDEEDVYHYSRYYGHTVRLIKRK